MSVLTAPVVAPTQRPSDDDDDLTHTVCFCNPYLALCGTYVDGDWDEDAPEDECCVVCEDLERLPCARCGG